MGAVRAGVLGGTFDPPHLGHLVLAAAARRVLGLDRVLFVPAGDPWRKNDQMVSPADLRVRMVRAAAEPAPWLEVCTLEIQRPGPSYSAETLVELAVSGGEWWFIVGADALADMPSWHEPARLIAAARLAVASRGEDGIAVSREMEEAVPNIEDRIDLVAMPELRVSSTDLRARVRDGRPTEVLLPDAVRRVVDEAGLYR
jgi:nicotinate-nucleotide adenylyltransferase